MVRGKEKSIKNKLIERKRVYSSYRDLLALLKFNDPANCYFPLNYRT